MAGGKMNYRVQAELDTTRFKAGANSLRREFTALKSGFLGFTASLGASVGLFGILSRMKDVAINLNVARATLENVSDTTEEYAENLKYVDGLSKKYKQDIIVLTDSFAKFHAAAMGTNFSLEQQKKMYQGLVQAATYFHMSSERTENMLVAVEQMMSKGKVTAEELRRQLGNNLPGAYAKMAQAAIRTGYAGVKSFADFESAMKQGKIGVELLAEFIKDLNEQTASFNTDSMQLKINELKNAFTDFVESSNFEKFFSEVVDTSIKSLNWLKDNIKAVSNALFGIATVVIGSKLIGAISSLVKWTVSAGKSIINVIKKVSAVIEFYLENVGNIIDGIGQLGKAIFSGGGGFIALIAATVGSTLKWKKAVNEVAKEYEKVLKFHKELPTNNDEVALKQESKRLQGELDRLDEYFRKHPHSQYEAWKAAGMTPEEQIVNGMGGRKKGVSADPNAAHKAREWEANDKLRWLIKDGIDKISLRILELKDNTNSGETGSTIFDSEGTESDFEKLIKKYQKEIKELNNQFESGSITAQKYKEEAQDLAQKTWGNVTAFDNFRGEIAKLDPELRKVAGELEKAFVNPYLYDAVTKLSDATKGYYEEVGRLNVLKSAGLIKNQEDYNDALQKAGEKAVEAMAGINGLANVIALLDPLTQQLIGNIISTYKKGLNDTGTPESSKLSDLQAAYQEAITKPKVNHRFDYEKSQEEIIRAEAEAASEWAENIKKFKEKYADELSQLSKEQLDNIEALGKQAAESATNLTDLADVTKWLEDVKNLKKELGKGIYGSVKDTAEAMDRLTSGAKSFKKTMEDTDSTVWDKILESINLLIQSIDTVISLVESYNTISEISRNLSRAKDAEELGALNARLAGETGLIAAKNTELAADKLAEAQAKKNATASLAETSAKSGEAIAGATASGAKMPFPYNLIAIAAGVSAVLAALSSISRFAGGGVVSGSKHGDRNLAAVNGGEMILNQNQQGRLWNWLNSGSAPQGNASGKVEFVISGSNLRGVLRNEEKIRTGRS